MYHKGLKEVFSDFLFRNIKYGGGMIGFSLLGIESKGKKTKIT